MPKTAAPTTYADLRRVELDRLRAKRKAINLDALGEAANKAAQADVTYRASDEFRGGHGSRTSTPFRASTADPRAIELSLLKNEAADALRKGELEARAFDRQIANLDALLNANVAADSALAEASAIAEELAGLVARDASLQKALPQFRAQAKDLDSQQTREREATAERDVEAIIAGKIPHAAPSAAEAELTRVQAAIAQAERMLTTTAERMKALRARWREVQSRYLLARFNSARLKVEEGMFAMVPMLAEMEAARRLADVNPADPVPLDQLAVQRAMQAIRDALPRLPAEPATDDSEPAQTLLSAATGTETELSRTA